MSSDEEAASRFRVGSHRLGDRTLVIPVGEVDIATSGQFRAGLDQCDGDVVVDLSGVTFLDSSGIGVIVGTRSRLLKQGGSLQLRDPQSIVRTAIEAVGLGDWIAR